jgi:hypothetical protein
MPFLIPRRSAIAMLAASFGSLFQLTSSSDAAPPAKDADDLDTVLRQIAKTEQAIHNITVEGSVIEQHLIANQWVAQPITVALLARYDGTPGGHARFDVHKQVFKWIEGDGPYSDSSYSAAFDGKSGKVVHISGGALGRTGPDQTAMILPGRPPELRNGACHLASGARFHAAHWDLMERQSLVAFIKAYLAEWGPSPGTQVQIGREKRERVEAIRLDIRNKFNLQYTWWLDPGRGHNLIGYRQTQMDKKGAVVEINEEDQVVDLAKVVDKGEEKLWYPKEGFHYFPADPGETKRRLHYKATRVVLNDPAFDEAAFDIPIPPGYVVHDRINNRTFQVKPPGPPPQPGQKP